MNPRFPIVRRAKLGKVPVAPPRRLRGLGDLVAVIAQPVARALDRLLKTKLKDCGGCKERQDELNEKVPFK